MTDIATATKASMEVRIGGKMYTCSPLEQVDYGEFAQWVKQEFIEMAKRSITDETPPDQVKVLLEHAYNRASRIRFDSLECLEAMATFDGSCKLAQLMLRKKHPELDIEQMKELLFQPENVEELMRTYDLLHPESVKKDVGRRRSNRAERRRARKRRRQAH